MDSRLYGAFARFVRDMQRDVIGYPRGVSYASLVEQSRHQAIVDYLHMYIVP